MFSKLWVGCWLDLGCEQVDITKVGDNMWGRGLSLTGVCVHTAFFGSLHTQICQYFQSAGDHKSKGKLGSCLAVRKQKSLQKCPRICLGYPPLPQPHLLLLPYSFHSSSGACLPLPLQAKLPYPARPLHFPLPHPRTSSCLEHPLSCAGMGSQVTSPRGLISTPPSIPYPSPNLFFSIAFPLIPPSNA